MAREKDETIHPVDRHVGRRVQEKRLNLGLTQTALANAVGVSFQQVQKYEKGTNRVSASKLFEIARFMKEEIAFFFDGVPLQQPGMAEPAAPGFDHDFPMTRHSVEISKLAARLPVRKQKAVVQIMREMLDEGGDGDA
ncbi:transcriptional repressor DicA [Brevundimonas sp. SH203]|uniref:helix-turn-helix domain-containing protein n=1 Tax=Brevundimonas sp. SH203 TaxID=345167 RepID=UPI0009C60820|nr:helix-turn-helix transcriptional regulator [Brevundimonas sp. SH203]GAW41672.1 transcriptional repressor DicA [Brevundimonas sp. SH203]